jgi:adenine-specific DNA-methyltransferase
MSDTIPPLTEKDGESKDLVAENIEKLKQLFPEIVTDGKVDFETLQEVLGDFKEDSQERYSFTWNGKNKARKLAMTPSRGTLRPAPEESVNWDSTENLFIEGDNLEVLKLLQRSYHGKVKMIYIDPPYNTGNDFVYNDDFKDNLSNYLKLTGQKDGEGNKITSNPETSGRYHTDWLNMMFPRLKLARELMSDDGVIFVSIDDHELSNLQKLMNDVFGEENFLGLFVVKSTPNARDYGHVGKMHEFVLFYGKNSEETTTKQLPVEDKSFSYEDARGEFNIHPLYNSNVAFNINNRPNLYYPFYLDIDSKDENGFFNISLEKKNSSVEVFPPKSQKEGVQFVWRWGKDKSKQNLNEEIIGYETQDGEYRIVQKMRHTTKVIRSLLLDKSFSSRRGTAEVEDLFGYKVFDFPKPVELLKKLVYISTVNEGEIVLDLFAGSCSISDAVLRLNLEDELKRKFISIQLPESTDEKSTARKKGFLNIADIGKERIRKVLSSIEKKEPNHNGDLGFRVFKLNSSNLKPWDPTFEEVQLSIEDSIENIKPDRSEHDVLYEILLKYGLDLSLPIEEKEIVGSKVFVAGAGALFICLAPNIDLDVVEGIAKLKKELEPELTRVVFRDSGFKDDVIKTNAVQILKQHGIEDVRSI